MMPPEQKLAASLSRRSGRSWLVVATALFSLFFASLQVAFAQGNDALTSRVETDPRLDQPLADVQIEGHVTIDDAEIFEHIRLRPGRTATSKQIRDDVAALVRTRWFLSVEPALIESDDGPVLVFRFRERPVVRHVEFIGNKHIKTNKLQALTNLRAGSPYDVNANRECVRRIQEEYQKKGYTIAKIELEKGGDPDDREVIFRIDEGPYVYVSHVEIVGNEYFSDALLKTKLATKTRILWVYGGKYDPSSSKDDIQALNQYYRGLGFFDVEIEPEKKISDDQAKVVLVYKIKEGIRFRLRDIEIVGANIIPETQIRSEMKLSSGQYWNARDISLEVERIRTMYGELGRIKTSVDARPGFAEEPGIVDLRFIIEEGNVTRIRNFNVHIVGDYTHSKTSLARHLSVVHPGDLADPKKFQLTKSRLGGSGYFKSGMDGGPRIEITPVENQVWWSENDISLTRGQNGPLVTGKFNSTETPRKKVVQPTSDSTDSERPGAFGHSVARPPITNSPERKPAEVQSPAKRAPVENQSPVRGQSPQAAAKPARPVAQLAQVEQPYFFEPEVPVVRAQSDRQVPADVRAQSDIGGPANNFGYNDSNQGDPFGRALRNPTGDNLWSQLPPPDFIDVDAYVSEAQTGRLMFGVGVNSNSGVVGNIVLSEQNFDIFRVPTSWDDLMNGTAFRGGGQKLRIEALPGTQVSRYMIDWQNPYFLDSNFSLGVSGFYFQRFYEHWNEERFGGRIRIGRQLTQTLSIAGALRLEDVSIGNVSLAAPSSIRKTLGDNLLSTARLSLIHDTRDAPLMPGEGHYLEGAVEQAFGEFNYTRLELDGAQYFTTYKRIDGGGRHILRFGGNLGWSSADTPVFERFYAGGFQSFRGAAFRGVSPIENGFRVGGNFMALGSVEYSIPIMVNEMVRVVGFTDFGTVDTAVSFSDFRVSVGGGLRVTVPQMGPVPIALDWAVPILREKYDNRQMFSFYVGVNY